MALAVRASCNKEKGAVMLNERQHTHARGIYIWVVVLALVTPLVMLAAQCSTPAYGGAP